MFVTSPQKKLSRLVGALSAAVLAALSAHPGRAAEGDPARPNILLIVADDLGYGDLGFQGGKDVPTPNLDRLAGSGVRFTNGYVSCPVCSPTRAGLSTGRYQQRFGHEFNPGQAQAEEGVTVGLPLTERTLAQSLRDAGYITANVGKWHLGSADGFRPLQRGFDEFYGFLGGAHPYIPGKVGPTVEGVPADNARQGRRAGRRRAGNQPAGDPNAGGAGSLCIAEKSRSNCRRI
jgi:arylsulfatase A-like enzyme